MRARYFVALACALSTASAFSCSDDGESQDTMGLNPQGGSSGSGNGMAGSAGSANGGSASGMAGSAGSANGGTGGSQGGSSNGGGGSANAGAAGSGMGGAMAQGGSAGSEPDDGEPDAGPGDPPDDTVSFAADLHMQIFVARCSGCHGSQWGSGNLATAYAAAVANAEDIVARVSGEGPGQIMPQGCGQGPGQGQCLSVAQVELIEQWVDDGTPQ